MPISLARQWNISVAASIVSNSEPIIVEGESPSRHLSIVEFPSIEDAQAWYDSPEYAFLGGAGPGGGLFGGDPADALLLDQLQGSVEDALTGPGAAIAVSSLLNIPEMLDK
jgi:hypothetical protein